jgi:hypothetical protein
MAIIDMLKVVFRFISILLKGGSCPGPHLLLERYSLVAWHLEIYARTVSGFFNILL